MSTRRGLVLDANILIRAVLGRRVRSLLEAYEDSADFYAPDVCFEDARKYVPGVLTSRGEDPEVGLAVLEQIRALVTPVHRALYQDLEQSARRRVATRDEEDWPVVAVAFLLDVPIWTEDQDFFGSGIATWTTDRVELYFEDETPAAQKRNPT
jgi:predicted nucleic acid-binding protein